jgi:GNAT superfamily N-acetyltransferase
MTVLRFRAAVSGDAEQIALLHAGSWRRHYRGAYADAFLDGDIITDRRAVWSARLATPAHIGTILAEDDAGLAGFVHVVFDDDARWGSLIDNLHVTSDRRRTGIGSELLTRAADAVTAQAAGNAMYLWVLEQNTAAQQFYKASGGTGVEQAIVEPPGGISERLNGSPVKLRFAWPSSAQVTGRSTRYT